MEHQPLLSKEGPSRQAKAVEARVFRRRLLIVLLFFAICYSFNQTHESLKRRHHPGHGTHNHKPEYKWPDVPTEKHLVYHPCYQNDEVEFECARLALPLDHFNGTSDAEISLAIIRLPAEVPVTDPRYAGAIITNPGGPGGSGVGFLQRGYKALDGPIHHGAESNDTRYYDFISFDPRGIGLSQPQISCFTSSLLSWTWELRTAQEGVPGSSDAAFGRLYSMASAIGGSCSLSAQDPEDIKRFVSTASVATDMLHIVDRHAEWRDKEVKRLQGDVQPDVSSRPSQEKINYWGFSYGTYLGMTFAAMYPDRIGRFIIDGVVDAVDYTEALWGDNLADAEKALESIYEHCASAGWPACQLANQTGETTSRGVKDRYDRILNSLVHNPLPVIGSTPDVITYSDVKNLLFAAVYTPVQSSWFVANALAGIEKGDGSLLAQLLRPYHEPFCPSVNDDVSVQWGPLRNSTTGTPLSHDATMAIACGDGDSQSNFSRADFKEHWHELAKISPTVGPMWSAFRMQCSHYTVRPGHRYAGPWRGETSFPILLIGNSADPVTPVRNARKMAKGYKDARVLEQGSPGHCSSAAFSRCTRKVIHEYFQNGTLPPHDSFCPGDEFPFGDVSAQDLGYVSQWQSLVHGAAGALMPAI